MIAHIQAPAAIGGRITAPPSKSMAHRAVLSAALARGCSRVENLEFSQDVDATLTAAARLGADYRPWLCGLPGRPGGLLREWQHPAFSDPGVQPVRRSGGIFRPGAAATAAHGRV